ncbi:hypothetical protein SJI19_19230 [Acerihabitans sp. TG2]|uniref:hypothetical protein n=1 Tax=Acerihabitans sp. TG2 TaxID=3096008 RepID=UPI002B22A18A|nr:hypothetical protein [Acerihabitans sp. TG2]MEA9392644.1 hypothetical protein [Acerihabitans sp. TG2]
MSTDNAQDFSPKEFMKQRRPERFSDSVVVESGSLDRPILEHYISSLNARSQELEFEGFAKRLCEKIICPNLLAQTGPVAGGDGKTDTQTFPVSEQIALLWYEGINDASHKERWAFAVSTRKDWKKKCKEDVTKVKDALTGYKKVFCITNQYVKSNQRSAVEAALSKETSMDVRILDISWILDQIFKERLQYIAIEELSVQTYFKSEVNLGDNDYKKKRKLDEIKHKIEREINPTKIKVDEVSVFLDMAILSAELEYSNNEVNSQFMRAIKIAEKFGTNQQKLEAYYQYAWKSHFWLEDFETFEENLSCVYKTIISSTNASKWEYLLNLVTVNKSYLRMTKLESSIDINSIEGEMLSQLNNIAKNESRPSNSLYAKTQVLIYQLQNSITEEERSKIFSLLLDIMKGSTNLIGYPFEKMFGLINEMDDFFNGNHAYENLLDFITKQLSLRDGEIIGAEMQLKRGIKRLSSGKPYEAIKIIGKSMISLYKKESSDQFILALKVCSAAYESVGLLWSARACMVFAASMLTDRYWDKDELNIYQLKTYYHLSWLELKLGRLGYALKWLELTIMIRTNIGENPIDEKDHENMDAFISQLILNMEFEVLKKMSNMPEALNSFNFFASSGTLIYILGHEDTFEQTYHTKVDNDLLDYLIKLRDFNFGVKPCGMNHSFGRRGTYFTNIAGCQITINFPNRSPFHDFSTSLLSILEGTFATCVVDKIHPKEPSILIDVTADDDHFSICHEIESRNRKLTINIVCSGFDTLTTLMLNQDNFQSWSQQLVLNLIPEIFLLKRSDLLEKMLLNDGALERLSTLGASIFASANVLGNNIDSEVTLLFTQNESGITFPLKRDKAWDFNHPKTTDSIPLSNLKFGKESVPKGLEEDENIRHDDFVIQNLIKPRLWDLAKWHGVVFLQSINRIPGFVLMFKNKKDGKAIFDDFFSEIGTNDDKNRIKITILKGISSKNTAWYKVIISESMNLLNTHTRMTCISRICTMTPSTTENLDRFIQEYTRLGACFFGCNSMLDDIHEEFPDQFGILIKNINVKWAWQIEKNDPDIIGLNPDDTIYIPDGVDPAPITALLETLKNRNSAS